VVVAGSPSAVTAEAAWQTLGPLGAGTGAAGASPVVLAPGHPPCLLDGSDRHLRRVLGRVLAVVSGAPKGRVARDASHGEVRTPPRFFGASPPTDYPIGGDIEKTRRGRYPSRVPQLQSRVLPKTPYVQRLPGIHLRSPADAEAPPGVGSPTLRDHPPECAGPGEDEPVPGAVGEVGLSLPPHPHPRGGGAEEVVEGILLLALGRSGRRSTIHRAAGGSPVR